MSSAQGIAQSRYLKKRLKKARSHCKRIKRIKFNLVDYGILDFCKWNANFRWPTMAHINILTTQPQRKWQENLSNCERFSVCPPVISSEAGYGESPIDFMESHMFMCFFHELFSHHKKGVELRKMNQRLSGVAYITCYNYNYIRRPLPSFGLGGAAPGSTVGVQHGPVPALSFSMAPSKLQKLQKLLSGTFSATLPAAFDGLSLLCHGSSRGPTSCFCWASKLLSGTSEAPQAVSIGLRNCYLARFQRPLKASKPSQQLSTAFRCFAMGPPEAPRAVSVGLRNCYLALPKRHKLFLLGFETTIWHVFSTP